MEDIEQRTFTSCTVQLPFWKRYVGDAFTALPQEQIQLFHSNLNLIEPTFQFTIDTEVEGTFPFLDTRVNCHADGSLTTSVFRKKTIKTGIWNSIPTILWRARLLWPTRSSPEHTGSACRCLTGMLRRGTLPRPSTMSTPQGWLRETGNPRWHTALHLMQSCPKPWWSSRKSSMYPSPSGGSSHHWRSGLVFAHITPYAIHW